MRNLFLPNKKVLFLVIGLVFIIILLTALALLTPSGSPETQPQPSSQIPIFSPNPSITTFPLPSPQIPEIAYSPDQLEQDYERIINKQPLSQSDSQIRTRLIASLNNQSGYLEETSEYRIEYVKAPNLFMVEILSNDAAQAKEASLNWFKEQGLSDSGICNLPVSIYLSSEVSQSFSSQNQKFDPIPEECQ